jgi:serine/threonine protein kinase
MAQAMAVGEAMLNLAAEGVAEVVASGVGAVIGGPIGGGIGWVVGKGINLFGQHIVQRWLGWLRPRPRQEQARAIEQLSAVPPQKARQIAAAAVERLAPQASREQKQMAVEYVAAIPQSTRRSLVADRSGGRLSLPASLPADCPQTLLRLLPVDVPPYPPGSQLPGTPYRLEELLGMGGFGAVYRASVSDLQHMPFAIKFCLDHAMADTLKNERRMLERLMAAGKEGWSERIVRLCGYNLEHDTPFLVYEFVPDGTLTDWLAARQQQTGRRLSADEALRVVGQIASALAFAHERGLVHRDLKPANVLVSGKTLKLADFGLGGAVATYAVQHSKIGTSSPGQLDAADQVSLYRGAGTPLYVSPEQKRGEPSDPRHDIYSLGVLWYQLLAGDVTKELHPGWAKELEVKHQAPKQHIELLGRCVGWIEDRPKDAGELLRLLRQPASTRRPTEAAARQVAKPVTLAPQSSPDRPPKQGSSRTVIAAGAAAFGLLLLVGCLGVGFALFRGRTGDGQPPPSGFNRPGDKLTQFPSGQGGLPQIVAVEFNPRQLTLQKGQSATVRVQRIRFSRSDDAITLKMDVPSKLNVPAEVVLERGQEGTDIQVTAGDESGVFTIRAVPVGVTSGPFPAECRVTVGGPGLPSLPGR